jgi:hypothetical protein
MQGFHCTETSCIRLTTLSVTTQHQWLCNFGVGALRADGHKVSCNGDRVVKFVRRSHRNCGTENLWRQSCTSAVQCSNFVWRQSFEIYAAFMKLPWKRRKIFWCEQDNWRINSTLAICVVVHSELLQVKCICISHLTPWSRSVLDKLTVAQLVKTLPAFYWTRMLSNAHIWSLFWAIWLQ